MATKAFEIELKSSALTSEHAETPRVRTGGLAPEEEEFLAAVSPQEADTIYRKVRSYYE